MDLLTYCAHEIVIDHEKVEKEVLSLSIDLYHYDDFRNTYILPLFNPSGNIDKVDPSVNGKMKWALNVPEIQKAFTPILEELPGRLTILFTPKNQPMNIHLDCKKDEVGTKQYKWRYVVKGDLKGLYFLNNKMEKVYPNTGERSYIMDGGHPHSIDVSSRDKWTICIGSPWRDNLPKDLKTSKAWIIPRPEIKESWCV